MTAVYLGHGKYKNSRGEVLNAASQEAAEADDARNEATLARLQTVKDRGKELMAPTQQQTANAALGGQKLVWNDRSGTYMAVPMTPEEQQTLQAAGITQDLNGYADLPTRAPALPTTDPGRPAQPAAPPTLQQSLGANATSRGAGNAFGAVTPAAAIPRAAPPAGGIPLSFDPSLGAAPAGPAALPTPETAPQLDTSKLDDVLRGVTAYQQQIAAMAQGNPQLSAALAQLQVGLQATQDQALSLARTGGGRGRAGALQTAIEAGSDASGKASADAALLRATEEDQNRRFQKEALNEAAKLGIDTGALQLDVGKVNLDSVMQIVNQQFQQLGIDKQIGQQEAQSLRNYARDMAAIQQQYDTLSSEEQRFVSEQLLKKYQVDQTLANNLEQVRLGKPKEKPWYEELLVSAVGGAVGGATQAGTKALIG